MPGVDVFEFTLAAKNPEKHGGVFSHLGVLTQEVVEVIEHTRRVGAHSHPGKRALQHGREQGRAQAFAGNVGDEEGGAVLLHRKNIEVVPSNRKARKIQAADGEIREIPESARQKGLLDVAGDVEFLLEALALPFVLDQARVIEDAGGFGAQRVQIFDLFGCCALGVAQCEDCSRPGGATFTLSRTKPFGVTGGPSYAEQTAGLCKSKILAGAMWVEA